jgi:phospholipid/cholesterol/gamma-HCH transport system substrate-binding protein
MTTTKAQKIRIGMFVAISLGLIGMIVIVFGGMQFWKGKNRYRLELEGTVMGLETGAPVHFNGIRVGVVDKIAFSETDLEHVQVWIEVDEDTPVRTDTKGVLSLAGITGLKVIDLRAGSFSAPRLADGGTIPQGETTLDKLERQAKDIAERSGELMTRAQKLVDNLVEVTNPDHFKKTTANLAAMSENMAATSTDLRAMVSENRVAIRQSVAAIRETAQSATQVLDGEVVQLVVNASDFVSQLKKMVTSNEGTLRSAVFDLRQASRSFKDLAREVRQRPSRLLFSGAAGDRKMP